MSGLVVTFAMMETEKSDLIMKNFSRRRRNALGNIFKDVDHEELYEKLVRELDISACGGTESNPGSPDSTKTVENKSNRFGWVITTLHYIDEEKKTKNNQTLPRMCSIYIDGIEELRLLYTLNTNNRILME